MSKKTIVFKMPTPDAARRDEEPAGPRTANEAAAAAPRRESAAAKISGASEPDQWVRRGDPALAPAPDAPIAGNVFAVDLARERDFGEVVALGLALPAMLAWFWLANTMDRYRRIFAD